MEVAYLNKSRHLVFAEPQSVSQDQNTYTLTFERENIVLGVFYEGRQYLLNSLKAIELFVIHNDISLSMVQDTDYEGEGRILQFQLKDLVPVCCDCPVPKNFSVGTFFALYNEGTAFPLDKYELHLTVNGKEVTYILYGQSNPYLDYNVKEGDTYEFEVLDEGVRIGYKTGIFDPSFPQLTVNMSIAPPPEYYEIILRSNFGGFTVYQGHLDVTVLDGSVVAMDGLASDPSDPSAPSPFKIDKTKVDNTIDVDAVYTNTYGTAQPITLIWENGFRLIGFVDD